MTLNTRAITAIILAEIFDKHLSLNKALENPHLRKLSSKDRAFVQELSYGVMRWYWQLDAILSEILNKPLKSKDNNIRALLLAGLYQLHHLRIPTHAAIHETVQATYMLNKQWASGLVNGVLRQWQRNDKEIINKIKNNAQAFYSHPKWLLTSIGKAWKDQAENIFTINNQRPPMTLRVNLLKQKRDDYLQTLQKNSILAHADSHTRTGIILDEPQDATTLPGFMEGKISVQDSAAQLATELLEVSADMRVLDACAAPGGKTAHILESQPLIKQLVAIDIDDNRLKKIAENFHRLGFNYSDKKSSGSKIILLAADASTPENWWDGKLFDRILLDAPCSATGIIRRHPDIKFLKQPEDISALAAQQFALLKALWPLLKPGGILLYVTCSILPEENSHTLQKFLNETVDAKEEIIQADWGIPTSPGRQVLPSDEMDGFFYGKIRKKA